jgi:hypothetical protein
MPPVPVQIAFLLPLCGWSACCPNSYDANKTPQSVTTTTVLIAPEPGKQLPVESRAAPTVIGGMRQRRVVVRREELLAGQIARDGGRRRNGVFYRFRIPRPRQDLHGACR